MVNQVSAQEVYQVISKTKGVSLTEEQRIAVEEASTDWPTLVVAGAGSGKTELMATRVLWLVANQVCRPEEILGLTFTRKAASELSRRITNALTKLSVTPLWPADLPKEFAQPNITTYNSYANALYRDYSLALGFEDDALLLTDASRYQLAREVVMKYGSEIDARLLETDLDINSIIDGLLALAGSMTDNEVTADAIENHINGIISQISKLPVSGNAKVSAEAPIYAALLTQISGIISTPMLAKLAEGFISEKHRRGMIDYSDQVALAYRAVRELGSTVTGREQGTYKQVLLDEFQDTSTMQINLLSGLFAGTSVLAVGDPNQSIYGWRGASASNLAEFLTAFGNESKPVQQLKLSRSWRNPHVVLKLANHILGDLKKTPNFFSSDSKLKKVEVGELDAPETAAQGKISINFAETMHGEVEYLARWFKEQMVPNERGDLPTAAVLMRKRKHMDFIVDQLEREGLTVDVVGLGGLLESPEIVDLISALRVVYYPQAGANLMRLLAGPRWQVSPRDLQQLHIYSRKVSKFYSPGTEKVSGQEAESSLIDALDLLREEETPSDVIDCSDRGLAAMIDCANLLAHLRTQTGLPLVEFVKAVAAELWLDIELTANPVRVDPMARLNSFYTIVQNYVVGNTSHLGGFLEWLEYADSYERFETPSVSAKAGVVQVITAHTAKGLEWDLVAVPRLVDGVFPDLRKRKGWLSKGVLPFALRKDKESLPTLDIAHCEKQGEVKKQVEQFIDVDQVEYMIREDRRLAYVAFTRPRQALLLSGAKWTVGAKRPVEPSLFLLEAAELSDARIELVSQPDTEGLALPTYPASEANPIDLSAQIETWPMEPLGEKHRIKVESAASAVEAAKADKRPDVSGIDRQIDLLVAERESLTKARSEALFPVRIPASGFKDFVKNLGETAERYRRPMPGKPYKQTMAGTLFHGWVEAKFGALANSDELDFEAAEVDDENTTKTVEELQTIFERSRFANLKPFAIECEIQVTFKGNTFICKLDAVFETEDGYEIVDWKTGKPPVTDSEIAERALQLALYRMAFTKLHGVDPKQVEVCLYYVADDLEIRPATIPSTEDLLNLWDKTLEQLVV